MGKRERKREKKRRAGIQQRRGPRAQGGDSHKAGGSAGSSGRTPTKAPANRPLRELLASPHAEDGGVEPRELRQYRPGQKLLVLGDGDFSFSAGLSRRLGKTGSVGILATSFDSQQEVRDKYGRKAESSLQQLTSAGAMAMHGVDATKLPPSCQGPFDIIVFNFPHTGSQRVHLNRQLLRGFFACVQGRLVPGGEIHVTIKTVPPYSLWDVPGQAQEEGLALLRKVPFHFQDFPGYNHRTTEKDAMKFDAFEKRCVTFVFAPRKQTTTPKVAALSPQEQPQSRQPDAGDKAELAAKKPERQPRNKKLRLVQLRKERLERELAASTAGGAATKGAGEPKDMGKGQALTVKVKKAMVDDGDGDAAVEIGGTLQGQEKKQSEISKRQRPGSLAPVQAKKQKKAPFSSTKKVRARVKGRGQGAVKQAAKRSKAKKAEN